MGMRGYLSREALPAVTKKDQKLIRKIGDEYVAS